MTYYYQTKEAALAAAIGYEGYWETRASFVPNNGWVIVLQPRTLEVFKWPLYELLDQVEIDLAGMPRLSRKPEGYIRMAPSTAAPAKRASSGGQAAPARPKMEVIELSGEQRIKPAWDR